MPPTFRGWMILALLLGVTAYCLAEEITLTTYYPSPRGVYQELRTAGDVQLGSLAPPGGVGGPPSPAPRLYIAQDTSTIAGDSTTLVAPALRVDRRDATTGALSPLLVINEQGNVGIGTSGPLAYRLDVQGGQINVSDGLCIGGSCRASWSAVGFTNFWVFDLTSCPPPSCSWSIPSGVTKIMVEVWGGGGGGAATGGPGYSGGGGGGGGGFGLGIFPVMPAASYTVTVGDGGSSGIAQFGNGGDGQSSSFGSLISADKGRGGTGSTGGLGGGSTAAYTITGGSGGGGTAAQGSIGGGGMGGAAGAGGAGGGGGGNSTSGSIGSAPGGGGGGGGAGVSPGSGGAGAPGRVVVYW